MAKAAADRRKAHKTRVPVAKAAADRRKAHKRRDSVSKAASNERKAHRMKGFVRDDRRGRARSNYMPGTLPERRHHRTVEGRLAGKVPPLKGDLARFCLAKYCSEPRSIAEKQLKVPKATAEKQRHRAAESHQSDSGKTAAKSSVEQQQSAPGAGKLTFTAKTKQLSVIICIFVSSTNLSLKLYHNEEQVLHPSCSGGSLPGP